MRRVCDLKKAFCNLINMLVDRNESGLERRQEKKEITFFLLYSFITLHTKFCSNPPEPC